MNYIRNFTDEGYTFDDISDISQIQFYDSNKGFVYYGNPQFNIIIKPIV